jgi:hypothetical protein
VSGRAYSDDFPTTGGAFTESKIPCTYSSRIRYAYVSKFDPSGTSLIYSTYLGPISDYATTSISVDEDGIAFVTGTTNSVDFPTTPDSFQPDCDTGPFGNCANNAFVTKLNASGSGLVYSTFLGGAYSYELCTAGNTYAYGIAVDDDGCAYVAGHTKSLHFSTTGWIQ